MKKFIVLIEDDFEIKGNGLGNVAELQYLPALNLINIANKYNAKITFMVDVAHQLTMKKYLEYPEIKVQSNLWDDTVLLMKENGHDVQLHLHPQWIDAIYKDGYFFVNDNWNIGRYNPEIQHQLIYESVNYLHSLLRSKFHNYKVTAFKAGSWGMQPFSNLYTEFEKIGINIVMGVRSGLYIPSQGINYMGLEGKYFPYFSKKDDVTKVSQAASSIVVLPLQPYSPNFYNFSKYIFDQFVERVCKKTNLHYSYDIPKEIKQLNPLKDKSSFSLGLKPYHTHLKIGNQKFSYLKSSFDSVIRNLERYEFTRIPVVIESHTKQYHGYYKDIEKFIAYIAENYESIVEFSDISNFSQEIISNPQMVLNYHEDKPHPPRNQ